MPASFKWVGVISALVVTLGVAGTHALFHWFHYLAGAGSLSYKWIFVVKPLFAGLSFYGVALGARWLVRARALPMPSGIVLALSIAAGLGIFVCAPSASTGGKYLCKGLAHRIQQRGLEKLMNQHLQSLVKAKPSKQTEERYEDVTEQSPAWIRENFPEKNLIVQFVNGTFTHVRVLVGGPYLRYGYYVGSTASDIPTFPQNTVVQNVNSNVVVFVQ